MDTSSFKLLIIDDSPHNARRFERSGVDRIFVDLETLGKRKRQASRDTLISSHDINNIPHILNSLSSCQVLVRVNPWNDGSEDEIERVLKFKPHLIMLPMFTSLEEVRRFLGAIDGRARTVLLFETSSSVELVDRILDLAGIDEAYIGLNDLSLSLNQRFIFQPLLDGVVERLASCFVSRGIPFGFGGLGPLDGSPIPGELLLKEHHRLGSSGVILGRSFRNRYPDIDSGFYQAVEEIRRVSRSCALATEAEIELSHRKLFDLLRLVSVRG